MFIYLIDVLNDFNGCLKSSEQRVKINKAHSFYTAIINFMFNIQIAMLNVQKLNCYF